MKKIICAALMILPVTSSAYMTFQVKTRLCRNGKTLGLVLAQQVGFVSEANPVTFVKYYCEAETLRGFTKGFENRPERTESQLKNCESESQAWVADCYEKEFKPNCVKDNQVMVKECFERAAPADSSAAPAAR